MHGCQTMFALKYERCLSSALLLPRMMPVKPLPARATTAVSYPDVAAEPVGFEDAGFYGSMGAQQVPKPMQR